MNRPSLVSLFDYSGSWSDPWRATHDVVCVDLQHGKDVFDVKPSDYEDVDAVLAAPPCTTFTKSGARWWKTRHDPSGLTALHVALVKHTLCLIKAWNPRVWALENPVGRLPKLVTELADTPRFLFHPYQYAGYCPLPERVLLYGWLDRELAIKNTVIYGNCARPVNNPDHPQIIPNGHTVTSYIGPSKDRTNLRSKTPVGFARAFYAANKPTTTQKV